VKTIKYGGYLMESALQNSTRLFYSFEVLHNSCRISMLPWIQSPQSSKTSERPSRDRFSKFPASSLANLPPLKEDVAEVAEDIEAEEEDVAAEEEAAAEAAEGNKDPGRNLLRHDGINITSWHACQTPNARKCVQEGLNASQRKATPTVK
jgi:hypothetical protein